MILKLAVKNPEIIGSEKNKESRSPLSIAGLSITGTLSSTRDIHTSKVLS